METMLTIQQVAEELGVSKSRVFQYIREGRLEAQRVGIQDLITRAHLDNVKAGLRKTTTGRPKKAEDTLLPSRAKGKKADGAAKAKPEKKRASKKARS